MGSLRRGCRPRLVCPHLAGSEVPPTDSGDANHGAEPVRIGQLPLGGTLPARHCVRSDRKRPGREHCPGLGFERSEVALVACGGWSNRDEHDRENRQRRDWNLEHSGLD